MQALSVRAASVERSQCVCRKEAACLSKGRRQSVGRSHPLRPSVKTCTSTRQALMTTTGSSHPKARRGIQASPKFNTDILPSR